MYLWLFQELTEKSTTTSMLSHILLAAKKDPTISVGGILKAIGGNIRVGSSELFVTEACEYTNSFLHFFPKIAVILNIDADHLDFFKDLDDIRHSFRRFAQLLPADGTLIINKEIEHLEEITDGLSCRVVTFGLDSSADYYADQISHDETGNAAFHVISHGKDTGRVELSVKGDHNICNALSVIAVADLLDISRDDVCSGLQSFTGTDRRFEHKGDWNGVTVIDDYAHHPTEIKATLKGCRCLSPPGDLVRIPASYLHPHKSTLPGVCGGIIPHRSCCPCRHLCRTGNRYPGGYPPSCLPKN